MHVAGSRVVLRGRAALHGRHIYAGPFASGMRSGLSDMCSCAVAEAPADLQLHQEHRGGCRTPTVIDLAALKQYGEESVVSEKALREVLDAFKRGRSRSVLLITARAERV